LIWLDNARSVDFIARRREENRRKKIKQVRQRTSIEPMIYTIRQIAVRSDEKATTHKYRGAWNRRSEAKKTRSQGEKEKLC